MSSSAFHCICGWGWDSFGKVASNTYNCSSVHQARVQWHVAFCYHCQYERHAMYVFSNQYFFHLCQFYNSNTCILVSRMVFNLFFSHRMKLNKISTISILTPIPTFWMPSIAVDTIRWMCVLLTLVISNEWKLITKFRICPFEWCPNCNLVYACKCRQTTSTFAYKHADDIIIVHRQWSKRMHTHTQLKFLSEIYATIIPELNIITFWLFTQWMQSGV